ncbi:MULTISPECIES: nuclease-related domain-containing protein [Methylotenera]|uniref:nuclease-related domain-containing protein n=1 Tax=Methylotenera TaxID=359407 RepID=UPI00037510ED|nr:MULTISPECIES: nuclease-related domain-containing protein [Methylotenera]
MIVKENLNPAPLDKFEKAGHDAERKVAYYLKMAFGDEPKLLILHDLRLEFEDGITAQMDHLLIHQFGLIIIESKSVAGKLQVKEDGQWLRWYSNQSKGMQNPIKQAQLQGQTLKRVLLNSSKENTRKVLEKFPIDVLVSISDSGEFIAHKRILYPEVCKADQVDDRIKEIVLSRAKSASPDDFVLSDINKTKLAEHLVKNHKPFQKKAEIDSSIPIYEPPEKVKNEITKIKLTPEIKQEISTHNPFNKKKTVTGILEKISSAFSTPEIMFEHSCLHCKSNKIEIKYGVNYYFKCLNCSKNCPITATCHVCKRTLKIRKDKKQFFAECSTCNTSELFHLNS